MGNCFSTLKVKKKANDKITEALAEINLRISGIVDANQKLVETLAEYRQEMTGQREMIDKV